MSDPDPSADDTVQASNRPSVPVVGAVRSEQLIGNGHELLIEHAGEIYRLRITRSGKLILTK